MSNPIVVLRGLAVAGVIAPAALAGQSVADTSRVLSDSAYTTDALRAFVERVASENERVPAGLVSYKARLESEVAMLQRTSAGKEIVTQVEQMESSLLWSAKPAKVDQRVIGYRTRTFGLTFSFLTLLRKPWVVPMLYGNHLQFLIGPNDEPGAPVDAKNLKAIHPLSVMRDKYYRFEGGDTAAVIQLLGRTIPLVRIRVEPMANQQPGTMLFRGEMYADATAKQLVRMRGEVVLVRRRNPVERLVRVGVQAIAFTELENAQVEGRFWLPSYQRIELQARSPLATEFRPVFRMVTHFRNYTLNDSTVAVVNAPLDTARLPLTATPRLTIAPRDSVDSFHDWAEEIGGATADVRASDFDDVMPDEWQPAGPSRLEWRSERMSDVIRSNRVEGWYTGASARLRFRDAVPGLTAGANAGWAWTEKTVRGGAGVDLLRGSWRSSLRAQRTIATTNDFVPALENELSVLSMLTTTDDNDYVDRRSLMLSVAHLVGGPNGTVLFAEAGPGADRPEIARVKHGLLRLGNLFRSNRPAARGSYERSLVGFEVHPNVTGEYFEPGIGAALSYERGDGSLRWQRVEARLLGRHTWRAITYATRLDAAAVVTPKPVPQQVIEFGENEGLPGYAPKEFGGDRAALLRLSAAYELPYLSAPVHVWRWFYMPSISPSIAFGIQSGWAQAVSASTRASLLSFGVHQDAAGQPMTDPKTGLPWTDSRPTGGIRSSVSFTMRLFGGAMGIGIAKAIDHRGPLEFLFATDQQW